MNYWTFIFTIVFFDSVCWYFVNMISFSLIFQTLYNQFKFFLNMYFLVVATSQFIPELRIGYLYTYWGPLVKIIIIIRFILLKHCIFILFLHLLFIITIIIIIVHNIRSIKMTNI